MEQDLPKSSLALGGRLSFFSPFGVQSPALLSRAQMTPLVLVNPAQGVCSLRAVQVGDAPASQASSSARKVVSNTPFYTHRPVLCRVPQQAGRRGYFLTGFLGLPFGEVSGRGFMEKAQMILDPWFPLPVASSSQLCCHFSVK